MRLRTGKLNPNMKRVKDLTPGQTFRTTDKKVLMKTGDVMDCESGQRYNAINSVGLHVYIVVGEEVIPTEDEWWTEEL